MPRSPAATPPPIHPIYLGLSVAFLLEGEAGPILLDAGLPGTERRIWARLRALGYRRADLRLVVLTHAHLDHCGCLPALLQESGAALAAHPLAAERLQGGPLRVPDGRGPWGKTMAAVFRLAGPLFTTPQVEVSRPLTDGATLEEWGLMAQVLHTPGHTADSLTLLLPGGIAFVGDLLEGLGRRLRPQPYFIEDPAALTASVERLRERQPQAIYTSHWVRPMRPPWGRHEQSVAATTR